MLQKQREDLDQITEENNVLKSRYENAVEVNVHYIEIFLMMSTDTKFRALTILGM